MKPLFNSNLQTEYIYVIIFISLVISCPFQLTFANNISEDSLASSLPESLSEESIPEKNRTHKTTNESNNFIDPSIVISICALLFTIFSFYWLTWRKGKLIVSIPRTYLALTPGENRILLVQLPLIFYNSGAANQFVQNLKLILLQDDKKSNDLYFNNTVFDLGSVEGKQWAKPFAIEGRNSVTLICAFQRTPGKFTFSESRCTAILKAKINKKKKWVTILKFNLNISQKYISTLNSNKKVVYDNDPDREFDI